MPALKIKIPVILVTSLIDILISISLIMFLDLNGLTGMVTLLGILFVSVLVSVSLSYLNSMYSNLFKLNVVFFPLLFYALLCTKVYHDTSLVYVNKVFSIKNKDYELNINKKYKTFDLNEIQDKNRDHTKGILQGKVDIHCDTFILNSDQSQPLTLHKNILIGYPTSRDTITLTER